MGPEEAHLGHTDIMPFGNLILCGLSEDAVAVYGPYTPIDVLTLSYPPLMASTSVNCLFIVSHSRY